MIQFWFDFLCINFTIQNEGATVADFAYDDPYQLSNEEILAAYYKLNLVDETPNQELPHGISHTNCGYVIYS